MTPEPQPVTRPEPQLHSEPVAYTLTHRVRFITAASLFDGHDASINIMRRILQSSGAEVIHLGHNRSVKEIVNAAIQEDAGAIAISSYQGGHVEFFKYAIDLLKEAKCEHIKVFGGGGGTITPREARELEAYGVEKLYSPEEGLKLGLQGIINDMLKRSDSAPLCTIDWLQLCHYDVNSRSLAQALTCIELGEKAFVPSQSTASHQKDFQTLKERIHSHKGRGTVIGMTGTGGAGKSSLTDELTLRILESDPKARVAILAIDPTRKKTGGALLGDRLRMNSLANPRTFMRSYATREANVSVSGATREAIQLFRSAGFDWIFVETGGIGQADTSIVDLVDLNVYVMTSEFGAPTQLEKINMLDYADMVVINKFEKSGSLDALNDVRKQFRRNHREFEKLPETRYPIYGTVASRFGDIGVDAAFRHLKRLVTKSEKRVPADFDFTADSSDKFSIVPKNRSLYLSEISDTIRGYHSGAEETAKSIHRLESLTNTLNEPSLSPALKEPLQKLVLEQRQAIDPATWQIIEEFQETVKAYQGENFVYKVRDRSLSVPLTTQSLSHSPIRKISCPKFISKADTARFALKENLPGFFPFTGGVFSFKRSEEDPKRQFAGEGNPARTNRRFHLLCEGEKAKRLSTAFDSVTLYGQDPDERPDIYGKIGESGVSVCTLDDAKRLYQGFDLCDPNTSVSMTINGPAPMLLAFFFNTAIDQKVDLFIKETGHEPSKEERLRIQETTLQTVRGTVQADILKEDQAQNTCIFSTEFALRMMGDIQQYFIDHLIRNYYSVSISGYHIAEAGANPITQLAFTLANGFTFVEYYRSRGMNVDQFAPNFSFFFSNGLDPEYTVIGRVARRIWAIAMRDYYQGNERSQKLKYHIQTSGRSLHAQEISFNDIRTTLQALIAYFDHCNSLHTNAYDEAVTTPTEESVRRAMAIQLIIARELGWAKNENPLQGSFFIEEMTDLVEQAVLAEFDRMSSRGGVLGSMETHYQRGKIQEESLYYERLKHTGEMPIVGVNTFLNPSGPAPLQLEAGQLTRATREEKMEQIHQLRAFQKKHQAACAPALAQLKKAAHERTNLFEALLEAARVCSLGQMTHALYEIGGEYRRSV